MALVRQERAKAFSSQAISIIKEVYAGYMLHQELSQSNNVHDNRLDEIIAMTLLLRLQESHSPRTCAEARRGKLGLLRDDEQAVALPSGSFKWTAEADGIMKELVRIYSHHYPDQCASEALIKLPIDIATVITIYQRLGTVLTTKAVATRRQKLGFSLDKIEIADMVKKTTGAAATAFIPGAYGEESDCEDEGDGTGREYGHEVRLELRNYVFEPLDFGFGLCQDPAGMTVEFLGADVDEPSMHRNTDWGLPSVLENRVVKHRGPPATRTRAAHPQGATCHECGAPMSVSWMEGPDGPATLCTTCGQGWAKAQKRREDQELVEGIPVSKRQKTTREKDGRLAEGNCGKCEKHVARSGWGAGPEGKATLCKNCNNRWSTKGKPTNYDF